MSVSGQLWHLQFVQVQILTEDMRQHEAKPLVTGGWLHVFEP